MKIVVDYLYHMYNWGLNGLLCRFGVFRLLSCYKPCISVVVLYQHDWTHGSVVVNLYVHCRFKVRAEPLCSFQVLISFLKLGRALKKKNNNNVFCFHFNQFSCPCFLLGFTRVHFGGKSFRILVLRGSQWNKIFL